MPVATPPAQWVLTTDPDRATDPDPQDTLLSLDADRDTPPEEKTRSFQTSLCWYICAPGFHQPSKTTQETVYPVLITLAGSLQAYRTTRTNFQMGTYGRLHPLGSSPHRGHLRVDIGPSSLYRWTSQQILTPATGMTDTVFTADMPSLFDRTVTTGEDVPIQFCCVQPRWKAASLLQELQENTDLCRQVVAYAEDYGFLYPARTGQGWAHQAPHWDANELLAQVPSALEAIDYLQKRTYRPIPQSVAFRLQLYLEACHAGLFTHARPLPVTAPDRERQKWLDAGTAQEPTTLDNPTAWAQHPGPPGLTLHSALPPTATPTVVACRINPADFDGFLLDQVTRAYKLCPALLDPAR